MATPYKPTYEDLEATIKAQAKDLKFYYNELREAKVTISNRDAEITRVNSELHNFKHIKSEYRRAILNIRTLVKNRMNNKIKWDLLNIIEEALNLE